MLTSILNKIYDWWNARKLEEMRLAAAYMLLCLKGEMDGVQIRHELKKLWFGERMTISQWHTVMFRLQDELDVRIDERWVAEDAHRQAFTKFYSVRTESTTKH